MKLRLSFALLLYVGLAFSQSKKEQIEQLTLRVDSLNRVLRNERSSNAQKTINLESTITQLNAKITDYTDQITSLNAQVSVLTADVQTNKAATASKQQELQALQAQLKVKQDSLTLVNAELLKLKPPVKPLVATAPTPTTTTPSGPYKTVTIGTQVWMTKNLDVSTFRNGDPIPEAKTNSEWEAAGEKKQPAWCYYKNDPANGAKYGKLYNWYAVNDPRGLAPVGYHIPTDAEWTQLSEYLGGEDVAGKKMKSTSGWIENGNGTNESGFNGLPGGYRSNSDSFLRQGYDGYCWSASEYNTDSAPFNRNLNFSDDYLLRSLILKGRGFSVRCLRD
jgi:uncharacterized protein (TIGR02145 family)